MIMKSKQILPITGIDLNILLGALQAPSKENSIHQEEISGARVLLRLLRVNPAIA